MLAALTALVGFQSKIVDHPGVFVTLRLVACAGLVAVGGGTFARGSPSHRRMAAVSVVAAYAIALVGLTAADSPVPFAIGRIATTLAILVVMYLVFAYPHGHIEDRASRLLVRNSAVLILALLAANLLLSRVPPVAGPFVRCTGTQCPANPLALATLGKRASDGLSVALALAVEFSLLGVIFLVAQRAFRATPLQRRSLAPLLTWTALVAAGYAFYLAVRVIDDHARLLYPAAVIVVAVIAALPPAIVLGMIRGRVFVMSALQHVVAELGRQSDPRELERTMATAFGDPGLQIMTCQPSPRRYVDVDGQPVDLAVARRGRAVTPIEHDGHHVAVLVHDEVLADDLVQAAGSVISLTLSNAQLQGDLSLSVKELEASRNRVAWAADEERRRIEQDLHDGAQQGLIALRIKLQLLEELAADDPRAVAPALVEAGRRVDSALQSIRDLAQGIYPAVLRDLGLSYALAALARNLPIEVTVHSELRRRLTPELETAVYFCCAEALQNVVKHGTPAARAHLDLREDPEGLEFVVSDDGPGFEPGGTGTTHGLAGMHDRLEAVGGKVTVESTPGRGTTVTGRVPAELLCRS